jgi:hypothetical protein
MPRFSLFSMRRIVRNADLAITLNWGKIAMILGISVPNGSHPGLPENR